MGHWFEILIILALALLVFGPKRMIEMGSQLGKAFRQLRDAAKEMDWSSLTGQNETTSTTPSPPPGPRYKDTPSPNPTVAAPPPPPEEQIVEGSLVDAPGAMNETATTSDSSAHSSEAPSSQSAPSAPDSSEVPSTQQAGQAHSDNEAPPTQELAQIKASEPAVGEATEATERRS
ncbi:MAG TPA: twin-arginine translocase TatA/TatE family subunit [Ktedonobacterales bacterium]|jgi:TatA/E family protein of Tat protein translocase